VNDRTQLLASRTTEFALSLAPGPKFGENSQPETFPPSSIFTRRTTPRGGLVLDEIRRPMPAFSSASKIRASGTPISSDTVVRIRICPTLTLRCLPAHAVLDSDLTRDSSCAKLVRHNCNLATTHDHAFSNRPTSRRLRRPRSKTAIRDLATNVLDKETTHRTADFLCMRHP
jgi:hypothetical protein